MVTDVVVGRETVYIGSHDGCRIHLPDSRIAPQQLVVYPDEEETWAIETLSSDVEVRLNGMNLVRKEILKTGDEIMLAEFVLRVFPEHEEPTLDRSQMAAQRLSMERFAAFQLPPGTIAKKPDDPLTIQSAQLMAVGKANLAVSQCIQPESLMNIALDTLLNTFNGQLAWIGLRRVNYGSMEYVEGRLNTGQTTDLPEIGDNLKPRVLDRGQFVLIPRVGREDPMSLMAGPLVGPDGTLGMALVAIADGSRRFETRDLDFFVALLNTLAVQLDAIFKQIARNRQAAIDGEVSVAHEVQARLTPRKLPQWPELQFGAFREPGRERSGDIYDVVRLASGKAALMVAHTEATGAMPPMLLSQAQAAFRFACMRGDDPAVFLKLLNWLLYDGQKDHPLHAFMGLIDPASGQMKFAVAGKIGLAIIGTRGDERSLRSPNPELFLGADKAASFPLRTETIEPEETLVAFTPGVATARNSRGEFFGEERFVNILCDGFGQLASAMLKEMLVDLKNFTEGGQQPEDITVLLAHRV